MFTTFYANKLNVLQRYQSNESLIRFKCFEYVCNVTFIVLAFTCFESAVHTHRILRKVMTKKKFRTDSIKRTVSKNSKCLY